MVSLLIPFNKCASQYNAYAKYRKIVKQMQANPHDVRFEDAVKVCCKFFGRPRQSNGSHVVFKTPWQGDPRINIQNKNGKAKTYQIHQILTALDKLKTSEEP